MASKWNLSDKGMGGKRSRRGGNKKGKRDRLFWVKCPEVSTKLFSPPPVGISTTAEFSPFEDKFLPFGEQFSPRDSFSFSVSFLASKERIEKLPNCDFIAVFMSSVVVVDSLSSSSTSSSDSISLDFVFSSSLTNLSIPKEMDPENLIQFYNRPN